MPGIPPKEASRKHSDQIPKPLQLAPLDKNNFYLHLKNKSFIKFAVIMDVKSNIIDDKAQQQTGELFEVYHIRLCTTVVGLGPAAL